MKAAQASIAEVSFGAAKIIARDKPEGLSGEALKAVMAAALAKTPAVVGVELADGYGVYRINKAAQPEKPDVAKRENVRVALTRAQAEADFAGFLESLKKGAKVELHLENVEKKPN